MSDLYKFGYTLDETIRTMRDVIDTGNHDRMFLDTYYWLKMLSEYREIGTVKECREAVEKQKVLCESSEKYADGKCVGYGKSEMDDEPIEMCKRCKSYVGFEESEEE